MFIDKNAIVISTGAMKRIKIPHRDAKVKI